MRAYTKYKNSSIEWIGEIPEHWRFTKLKYIGKMYSGLSGKSGEDFKQDEHPQNKPFIPFTNIANNTKIDTTNFQYVVMDEDDNQNAVKKGDLFFMMSSENYEDVGKSTILVDDVVEVYLNSFCKGFRVTDENVDSLFLNYLLLNHASRCKLMIEANGFTRINLKMEKVNDFEINLPPLNEQTIIANFLDTKTTEIDQTIGDKQQLINLYEEEKKALINEAVTKGLNKKVKLKNSGIDWLGDVPEHWEVKRLKYLADIKTGEKNTEDNEEEGQYPFFVRSQTVERISTYSFDGEAILTAGDGVGVAKVFHYINGKFDCHQRVYRISNFKEIIGKFLFHYLQNNLYKEVMKINAKSTVDSLRLPMFQNFLTTIPPVKEQTQIIQYIETETTNINNKISTTQQEIELLKEYKQALIFEAVTGKIDVRNN